MVESLGEIMLEKSKSVEDSLNENKYKQSLRPARSIFVWVFLLIFIILSVAISWNIFQQIHHRNSSNQRLDLLEEYISSSKIFLLLNFPSLLFLIISLLGVQFKVITGIPKYNAS